MNKRLLLSAITLLFFALIAGGSFTSEEIMIYIIVFVVIIIGAIIYFSVQSANAKTRREKLRTEAATNSEGFDRTVFVGNDRFRVYSDAAQNKLLIVTVTTDDMQKSYYENFTFAKNTAVLSGDCVYAYDSSQKIFLRGIYSDGRIDFKATDFSEREEYKDRTVNSSIQPHMHSLSLGISNGAMMIDESRGLIATSMSGKPVSLQSYINKESLPRKTGEKSYVNTKKIGDYFFVMDTFFKVVIIVTSSTKHVMNYSDILDISYSENGSTKYSKSASRTIGGAVVGGVLMGGAGAIVGGLSGSSKEKRTINSMELRISRKGVSSSSIILNFLPLGALEIKGEFEEKQYKKYLDDVNRVKDLLAAIMDEAKPTQVITQPQVVQVSTPNSTADELLKLAKLKEGGILTEEEFQEQKKKLLQTK